MLEIRIRKMKKYTCNITSTSLKDQIVQSHQDTFKNKDIPVIYGFFLYMHVNDANTPFSCSLKFLLWPRQYIYLNLNANQTAFCWENCGSCQMETFSALLALCEGNHRSQVDSPTKASEAELWCFLWSAPEQTAEQTIVMPVIWDAIVLIMTLM